MKQIVMFFLTVSFFILPGFAWGDVLLIANTSVPETSVSKQDVKMIFLGKKKSWQGGKKIKPATLKKGAIHETFVSDFVKKTAASYASFWKHALLSGTGIPPKSFSTENDLVNYVAGKEGAIGYVSKESFSGTNSVKILTIN